MDEQDAPTPETTDPAARNTPIDASTETAADVAAAAATPAAPATPVFDLDLDAIAADLADVETALARLEAGTYFIDEVTGEPLPEAFLIANPTARTLIGAPAT